MPLVASRVRLATLVVARRSFFRPPSRHVCRRGSACCHARDSCPRCQDGRRKAHISPHMPAWILTRSCPGTAPVTHRHSGAHRHSHQRWLSACPLPASPAATLSHAYFTRLFSGRDCCIGMVVANPAMCVEPRRITHAGNPVGLAGSFGHGHVY